MATLTIRNLPEEVREKLRIRAAHAGRSMEAEARAILSGALLPTVQATQPEDLQRLVSDLYGGKPPVAVVDELIRERRREALYEATAEGEDPEQVFGDQFPRICREAGLSAKQVRQRRAK